jgi:hypothetical protein
MFHTSPSSQNECPTPVQKFVTKGIVSGIGLSSTCVATHPVTHTNTILFFKDRSKMESTLFIDKNNLKKHYKPTLVLRVITKEGKSIFVP